MATLKPALRSRTLVCCPQVHETSTNNPCALWGFSDEFTEFKGVETRRRSWTVSGGTNGKEQSPGSHRKDRRDRSCGCVREATDRAEDVMKTGIQSAQRVADEFGRVFGFGGQNEDLTRQATQNLEAITETGTILMRGFQDASREWLELTQERLRKNAEGMTKLAQCRTLRDVGREGC